MRRFASWAAVCLFLWALPSVLAMEVVEDAALSEISAQTGITINASNFQGTATNAYWYDSDGFTGDPTAGYLSWLGLTMGPISLNMDINAGTDATRSYLRLDIASMTNLGVGINEVHVGNAVGANPSGGSLVSSLDLGPSYLNISGHDAGGAGVRLGGHINLVPDSYLAWGDSDGAAAFAAPGYLTLMNITASLDFDGLEVDAGSDATYSWLNLDFPATTLTAQAANVTISNVQSGDVAKDLGALLVNANIGSDFYLRIRGGGQTIAGVSASGLSMVGDISLTSPVYPALWDTYVAWYDTDNAAYFGLRYISLTYAATDEFHLDVSGTWVAWRWPEFTADVTIGRVVTGAAADDSLFGLRARIHMPEVEPGQAPTAGNVGIRFYQELEFMADSDIAIYDENGFTTYCTTPSPNAGWFTLHNAHLYGNGGTGGLSPTLLTLYPITINAGNGGAELGIPAMDVHLDVEDLLLGGSFDNGGSALDSCGGMSARVIMPATTVNISTH